ILKRRVRNPVDASKALPEAILEESAMLSHIVLRITSNVRRFHCIHNLTTNRALSISSFDGPVRLDPPSDTAPQQRHPRVDCSPSLITMPREQSWDMRLSRSYLAILLSLMLLTGL